MSVTNLAGRTLIKRAAGWTELDLRYSTPVRTSTAARGGAVATVTVSGRGLCKAGRHALSGRAGEQQEHSDMF